MSKPSELARRIVTGVLGGGLLVALLVGVDGYGVWIFSSFLCIGLTLEFSFMIFNMQDHRIKRGFLVAMSAAAILCYPVAPLLSIWIWVLGIPSTLILFLFLVKRHSGTNYSRHVQEMLGAIFGWSYLVFIPLLLPVVMASVSYEKQWLILFLTTVWATDVGAYAFGRLFGRHKLFPEVSPGKTIEGALGGLALALIAGQILRVSYFPQRNALDVLAFCLMVSILAQLGDLIESLVKRAFNMKDSGGILPGHGGIWDRFDSVVFSLPFMYAWVLWRG